MPNPIEISFRLRDGIGRRIRRPNTSPSPIEVQAGPSADCRAAGRPITSQAQWGRHWAPSPHDGQPQRPARACRARNQPHFSRFASPTAFPRSDPARPDCSRGSAPATIDVLSVFPFFFHRPGRLVLVALLAFRPRFPLYVNLPLSPALGRHPAWLHTPRA
jgi:hypothetical protein